MHGLHSALQAGPMGEMCSKALEGHVDIWWRAQASCGESHFFKMQEQAGLCSYTCSEDGAQYWSGFYAQAAQVQQSHWQDSGVSAE